MRARARHIKEKPNALNIFKAVSHNILQKKTHLLSVWCEMVDRDYVRCINKTQQKQKRLKHALKQAKKLTQKPILNCDS